MFLFFVSSDVYATGGQSNDLWMKSFVDSWNGSGCNRVNIGGEGSANVNRRFNNDCIVTVCQWFSGNDSPATSGCGTALSATYIGNASGVYVDCTVSGMRHVVMPKSYTSYLLYDYIGNVSDAYYPGTNLLSANVVIISPPVVVSETGSYGCYVMKVGAGNSDDVGDIYWIGFGDAYYDLQYSLECGILDGDPCPSPTPTPSPVPSQTPTPLYTFSPPPPHTPVPFVAPTFLTVPTTIPVQGEFSYDSETGMGTISVTIDSKDEYVEAPVLDEAYYEEVTSDIPRSSTYQDESSDYESIVEIYAGKGYDLVDNIASTSIKTAVDWSLALILEHPVLSALSTTTFETGSETAYCSLTWSYKGHDVEFSFCDLIDEMQVLKVVIISVASIYSLMIILGKGGD